MKERPKLLEQFQVPYRAAEDSATLAALHLFREIVGEVGETKARLIFAMWGTKPSSRRRQEIQNMAIIDRLDMMPGGPNIKELARQLAQEKYETPTPQQIETEERQIQRLNKTRKNNPYWPQREG